MISRAAYYCNQGHVWDVLSDTRGHDQMTAKPCMYCMLAATQSGDKVGSVFGPFPDTDTAVKIAEDRGVQVVR